MTKEVPVDTITDLLALILKASIHLQEEAGQLTPEGVKELGTDIADKVHLALMSMGLTEKDLREAFARLDAAMVNPGRPN